MKKHFIIFLVFVQSVATQAGDLISGIQYGETQEAVTIKLANSNLVSAELDESLFGRVGLNGSYETVNTLHGMKFKLYFDWQDNGPIRQLTQMTFRSRPISLTGYTSTLEPAWSYAQNMISARFGKPSNAGDFPKASSLEDGGIMYSHEWKTNEGFVYLGIGKEAGKLNLSISFHKNQLTAH